VPRNTGLGGGKWESTWDGGGGSGEVSLGSMSQEG
jgi:hypothetical protein